MNKTRKIVAKTMLHSAYVENTGHGDDALVVSEIVEYDDGTTEPKLAVYKNPVVPVWVTQKQYQDHPEKKEFESVKLLDQFDVRYKEKDRELFKRLNDGFNPNFLTRTQRREIYQSPYVYGANISVEAHVAMRYKDELAKAGKVPQPPTTGFFDIEQSLLPSSRGVIPLLSFTAENKAFLAVNKAFMYEPRNGKHVRITVDDIYKGINDIIVPLINQVFAENDGSIDPDKDGLKDASAKLPFEFEVYEGENEIDCILWIADRMHESKVSFIGVWNLGFDIPTIIEKLEASGVPLERFFCDPRLRNTGFAYASFREDKRDVAHFTQKWHWMTNTAHFQFIDSMCLYSYIRVVDGKEASYKLDDILKKNNLSGKLKIAGLEGMEGLAEADWHRAMLSQHMMYYSLYGLWDTMSLQLQEWLNNDLTAMMLLSDTTPPKFYPNQTIRVTNTLFQEHRADGYILGTGVDVQEERDDDLLTAGGAVLEPQHIVAEGLALFQEMPNLKTRCYAWQADFDFSALYPTLSYMQNISKQTKIATMLGITAPWVNKHYNPEDAIEMVCSYLITPNANGVELGVEFFNLPDYREMRDLFAARNDNHIRQIA